MFLKIHYTLNVVEVMFVLVMVLLVLIFLYSGIHLISGRGGGRQKANVDKDNFNAYDHDGHQINQNWNQKKSDEMKVITMKLLQDLMKTRN